MTVASSAPAVSASASWSKSPSRPRNSCAVRSSNAVIEAPTDLFSSAEPKFNSPTRVNKRFPVLALIVYVPSTLKPLAPAVVVSSTNSPMVSGSCMLPTRFGARPSTMKSWLRPATPE